MMGRQTGNHGPLFYLFNLEGRIPANHLLRRINPVVTRVLTGLRGKLEPFYSEIGRPSIDPDLMIRMLIVGYCYGIRFERKLCEEVELHLAYRWFCRLDLDDKVPDREVCPLKPQCCPKTPSRKVTRDLNEDARDHARALMGTPEFDQSRDERKKVEMRFAHLKTDHRFERLRLRGFSGARDEFHLAAIVQNLKTLASHVWRPPPDAQAASVM